MKHKKDIVKVERQALLDIFRFARDEGPNDITFQMSLLDVAEALSK